MRGGRPENVSEEAAEYDEGAPKEEPVNGVYLERGLRPEPKQEAPPNQAERAGRFGSDLRSVAAGDRTTEQYAERETDDDWFEHAVSSVEIDGVRFEYLDARLPDTVQGEVIERPLVIIGGFGSDPGSYKQHVKNALFPKKELGLRPRRRVIVVNPPAEYKADPRHRESIQHVTEASGGSFPEREINKTSAALKLVNEHLGVEEYDLFGHSQGGIIAVGMMSITPERVGFAVLSRPGGMREHDTTPKLITRWAWEESRHLVQAGRDRLRDRKRTRKTTDGRWAARGMAVAKYFETLGALPEFVSNIPDHFRAWDAIAHTRTVPMLTYLKEKGTLPHVAVQLANRDRIYEHQQVLQMLGLGDSNAERQYEELGDAVERVFTSTDEEAVHAISEKDFIAVLGYLDHRARMEQEEAGPSAV